MSIPKEIYDDHPSLREWNILHGYRGSISHGTYRSPKEPTSIDDKDTMAICVPPKNYYFGLKTFHSDGTLEIKHNEWDIVVYEAKKFIGLLKMGNPNVTSLLWLDKQYYINVTPEGQLLIDNRDKFMGKHMYKSYIGYAYGQLHRMTHLKFEGHMGIPGDLSSQSRFVKVAFTKLNSISGEEEDESVSQFFHILGSVDQQRGCCEVTEGKYEITIYTSCCNTAKGRVLS